MTTQKQMKDELFKDEPIQWHLSSSTHDKCPRCGGELGYLKQRERMCLSDSEECGTWKLPMKVDEFLRLKKDGGKIDYPQGSSVQRSEKLRLAAKLVREVCDTLDTGKEDPCENCGLQRHHNWDENQIHKELASAAAKIGKNAKRLAEGES